MITPCVNICIMTNGVCEGCGRTIDEIAEWTLYTDQERLTIMQRLGHEQHTGN